MLIEEFHSARPILEKLEEHNHKAFFVGGCVRDFLLKRPMGDIDIATSASPEMIQQIFQKVIPVGIEHGTVIVRYRHESYEVTTFRVDGTYTDRRHPDSVEFVRNIEQDLERRDFTVNALAMDKNGNIIDLFDGEKDLQNRMIRTVGDGFERFQEDPLRIIRALRFSSQLGFAIHPETFNEMKKCKQDIENLAVERVVNEITKLFAGRFIINGIAYLKESGVYKHLPVMMKYPYIMDLLPKSMNTLYSLGEIIALLHILEPEISVVKWGKEWKCSNRTKNEAIQLVRAYDYYKINQLDRWLVYQLDSAYYHGFVRLINGLHPSIPFNFQEMKQIDGSLPIHSKKDIVIDGNEIANLFPDLKRGPWLKDIIHSIEQKIVTGTLINRKIEIKEWIIWNPPEIN
ncbi:CCA tRNA nucleotidyltransferase [Virgibacillus ainsalahensis]